MEQITTDYKSMSDTIHRQWSHLRKLHNIMLQYHTGGTQGQISGWDNVHIHWDIVYKTIQELEQTIFDLVKSANTETQQEAATRFSELTLEYFKMCTTYESGSIIKIPGWPKVIIHYGRLVDVCNIIIRLWGETCCLLGSEHYTTKMRTLLEGKVTLLHEGLDDYRSGKIQAYLKISNWRNVVDYSGHIYRLVVSMEKALVVLFDHKRIQQALLDQETFLVETRTAIANLKEQLRLSKEGRNIAEVERKALEREIELLKDLLKTKK